MRGWPALSTCPTTFFKAAKKILDPLLGLQIAGPGGDLEPPSEGGTGLGRPARSESGVGTQGLKAELLKAMAGHIVTRVDLIGRYKRTA